jgi:hypothetical protein
MIAAVFISSRAAIAIATLSLSLAACDRSTTDGPQGNNAQSAGGSQSADAGEILAVCPSCQQIVVSTDAASPSQSAQTSQDAAVASADAATVAAPVVGIALVAFRIRATPDARGADAAVDLEMREDGSVFRRGQLVARFEGERLIDTHGREVLRLASDRVVMIAGMRTTQRLTDVGDMRRADGRVLRVEDDGRVVMIGTDGTRDAAPMRVEGFRPVSRATASLLLMYLALQP